MWRTLALALAIIGAFSGFQAVMAQDTPTPTAPALVITVILVPASPTPTYTPTPTPTVTPGPSETPTPTPSSTPQSALVIESRDETTGAATGGSITFTVTAGEFMIAVLLFALLSGQVITWVLKMRGK
jgi:hypothetical protein